MALKSKVNVAKFLDGAGKITQMPQKKKNLVAILDYLAGKFEFNLEYTEKEVNTICTEWHTFGDYFLLRRELIDHGFLCRELDGSRYWKPASEQQEEKN
ncbi:MAG: DUF2087 domain-containing protein [Lawsonibacter sp.]|nr:DUF2087 domain-containing protein [Lawsonibacter sp.]